MDKIDVKFGILGHQDGIWLIFDVWEEFFDDINLILKAQLQQDFDGLGLLLHDSYINSVSVPEDVQEMIDQRSGMAALGNMDEFMKYKVAMSLEDAAKNEGGGMGAMVGAGAGLGMGFAMPGMIQQSMAGAVQGGSGGASPLDKLKKLKELLDMEAISREEYEEKKKELMNKI